ncbi:MAG TPA: ribosomal protein S18-alanine N-acetyltransferase [Gemmatimonadaceae bacterium]|nr:ribosomal protein S18-alanine N-acetyltransferase [Gemmatimonadaceae bacterium]
MTAQERLAIVLRRAEKTDLDAVVAIERASFTDPPWSRESFTALVDSPRAYFTVACEPPTGAVVGYVVAWFVVDEAEIANLAVAPDRRGRGVGSRLLDAALTEARLAGAIVVHLEVRDSNAAARALYDSRGFEAVGRRRRYYRDPVEDALLLRRDLTAR